MTRLEAAIYKWGPIKAIINATKHVVLPGFEGLSLYQTGVFFFKEIKNVKLTERAAAVTYNFLMAIPPTLLFLFSLIPYLPLKDVRHTIISTMQFVTYNNNTFQSVGDVIVDFMNTQRRDILSFGILLTLFFSSNGMMGLMRSFDHNVQVYVKRTNLKRRWTAIKLTGMLLCVAIITLALFIIQFNQVNALLLRVFHNIWLIKIIGLITIVIILFCTISIIYTYGPSLTSRFKFVSPGSILATFLSVLTSSVFFLLVGNFLNYNKIYGSIGTLIAFMVWVWLNTLVILIGYELNVSILIGNLSKQPKK